MLAVAAAGPGGSSIKLIVRDGNVASSTPAGHDHLPADERELVVVDPDPVTAIQRDGIAAPDELRVELLHSDRVSIQDC